MRELIKNIVLRAFPELTAGLHLDRYARVVKVADAPEHGGTSERFRPRYAVDVEILTPDGARDEAFPVYEAVPLPVPAGAGMESGMFAFPEAGALVVMGFAYGRADHPVIRQIYPLGLSLPELTNGELCWQQSATVHQSADKHGNWMRQTEGTITDDSLRQVRRCVEAVDELSRELRHIAENSTEEIGGTKIIEALGAMRIASGGSTNISSVDSLNLTTARDLRSVAAANRKDATGGNVEVKTTGSHDETIGGSATTCIGSDCTQTVQGKASTTVTGNIETSSGGTTSHTSGGVFTITAPKVKIGSGAGGVSLLEEMLTVWSEIRDALTVLAGHTHPVSGAATSAPHQSGAIAGHGNEVGECRGRVEGIRG